MLVVGLQMIKNLHFFFLKQKQSAAIHSILACCLLPIATDCYVQRSIKIPHGATAINYI